MIFPFFTRLVLYLIAMLMPLIHPQIVVPYDWTGWWIWMLLVPGEMALAAFVSPPKVKFRYTLITAAGLLAVSLLAAGIGGSFWFVLISGIIAYLLSWLVFNTSLAGRSVAVLEQLFLAFIYYRLLNFSRSSEEAARASSGLTHILLVITICSFLLHGVALYFSGFFNPDRKRRRREVLLLAGIIPLFFVISFILPPDFVEHSIVFNAPGDDLIRDVPYDSDGYPFDRGGQGDRLGDRGGEGDREGRLQGIPSDRWGDRTGEGEGGQGRQYAVMVVASEYDPVYAAESYFGEFDPVKGFVYSQDEPLNELSYIRLIDTWSDQNPVSDDARFPFEVNFFSTIPGKVIPYRPALVEPTILNRRYHPFDYTYNSTSQISIAGMEEFENVSGLTPELQRELYSFLELDLPEGFKAIFEEYLDSVFEGEESYIEKIIAILRGFSDYQYQLGFDDNVHVEKLHRFLSLTREGDCTEFSNSAAILGRLAGIPSRVVTGYLASGDLQTFAHLRGLFELRKMIEPLQEYPMDSLYLVTTAHHHSWVQYYIPGYGWVDFEATSYAIPPPPSGDMNQRDVVIPLIQEQEYDEDAFQFPWGLMLRIFGGLAVLTVAGLYLFRYIRQLVLLTASRGRSHRALAALMQLALMKKAADGWSVKERWQTPVEYGEIHPEFLPFAESYTELRYRQNISGDEEEVLWTELRKHFSDVVARKKRGFFPAVRRFFSLKGLFY